MFNNIEWSNFTDQRDEFKEDQEWDDTLSSKYLNIDLE